MWMSWVIPILDMQKTYLPRVHSGHQRLADQAPLESGKALSLRPSLNSRLGRHSYVTTQDPFIRHHPVRSKNDLWSLPMVPLTCGTDRPRNQCALPHLRISRICPQTPKENVGGAKIATPVASTSNSPSPCCGEGPGQVPVVIAASTALFTEDPISAHIRDARKRRSLLALPRSRACYLRHRKRLQQHPLVVLPLVGNQCSKSFFPHLNL
ncbi:hypothetical protein FB451DRAFT_341284 [Mycena latifolia]|nr:hypothetical protein FB451DRAFT_341284 [Mycena latifolia]